VTNEQSFVIKAPPEKVWAFLTDPYQVAECLPGAAITEKVDDRTYLGTITVKVGPVAASYKGKVQFERLDPSKWEADLVGMGQDTKGKGGAEMQMRSRLEPRDGGTEVRVTTDVKISGILAQMGRGLIDSVSNQIFQKFAAAVQQKLTGDAGSAADADTSIDAVSLAGEAVKGAVKRILGT
jgi:carbon monoxide dehydrogenase subunit G